MDLFRDPAWLGWLCLWLAAFVVLARFASARRAALIQAFGRPETLARLAPKEAEERRAWRTGLEAAGVGFLFLALAGPQWGVQLVTSEATGIQVLLAVDTSRSMLAEDVQPSRIEKAKSELHQLIDGLKGQRVGIIAFAGRSHLVCPLTTDIDAAKSMLDRVQVGMIPQQGTAVGDAIAKAAALLGKYPGRKAVVVLSDGEDRRGDPLGQAKAAVDAGVRVYVLGVGTPEGGPIPLRDATGALVGYQKDKKGETVVSRLAEAPAIRLAAAGQGAYYRATPQETEAGQILKHLAELDRTRIQSGSANVFKNRYRFPLGVGILLLLIALAIPERASAAPPAGPSDRRRRAPALAGAGRALVPVLAALLLSGCGMPAAFDLWSGNRSYDGGDYDRAADRYAEAGKSAPNDPRPVFNAGAAEYKRGQFDSAVEAYNQLADSPKTPRRIAPSALYNLGNSHFRKEEYAQAADAYRRCLLLDPKDEDCRHNLVQSLKAKKNPPPKQDKKQDKKDDKDKKGGQDNKQQPPPPKPRPRPNEMSQEDAERILQAVKERERALQRQQVQQKGVKPQQEEEDW